MEDRNDSECAFPTRIYRNLLLFASAITSCMSIGAKAVEDEELTEAQLNALRFLHLKRDLVMRDVAAGLGFSFAAGTKTVDRLAQKGLAERIQSKEDGRQIQVVLTEKGELLAAKLRGQTEYAFTQILETMPTTDVDALNRAIERFLRGFICLEEGGESLCVACGFEDGLNCRSQGGDCLVKEAIAESSRIDDNEKSYAAHA